MKLFVALFLIISSFPVFGQHEKILTTEKFTIEGKVKKTLTVELADLSAYTHHAVDSIVITNHLGEKKSTLKRVKGVLLKDILDKAEIDAENHKVLSEYYFVCTASDNYKVVFSWNEIFNTEVGESVFIITAQNGDWAYLADNRIALISTKDQMTGRRYVKGLSKIVVERVK